MELNPYESPRVPQPGQEQEFADSNSIRQLLVEIRDGQRELLQLQRDALRAQAAFKRFAPLTMLVPLLVFGGVLGFSYYLRTSIIRPMPGPPASRVAPSATPATVPPPRRALIRSPSDKSAD